MSRKKKQIIFEQVTITDVAALGKSIARIEKQIVFVEGVIPGDIVDLKVIKKRKNYLEAIPTHFYQYGKARVEPFCKYFGTCGGCKWQHLDYEKQVFFKQKEVTDNLERIGKVALPKCNPIIPSVETKYYRNKLEFSFTHNSWLTKEQINSDDDFDRRGVGFHLPGRFDKILDLNHCYLQVDPSNKVRLTIKKHAIEYNLPFYNIRTQEGFLRTVVIRTSSTTDVMVIVLVSKNDKSKINPLMEKLSKEIPEITSLNYVINNKKNDTFHDLDVINYAGLPYITEEMEGIKFRVGPKSFFQTNSKQAYTLYKVIRDFVNPNGNERIYDLYTGTGTIALFIANLAKEVIGLEYVPAAIEDAKVNAEINNIKNTKFFAGDIKDLLNNKFISQHDQPDVIITDPPRAGMHPDVVDMLLKIAPKKIIYASCNTATQARDIALLDAKYTVKIIQPVDMFPHTYHVENVLLLTLNT